jgi:hypothetical protein
MPDQRTGPDESRFRRWLLAGRGPLVLSIAAVASTLIIRETFRISSLAPMSWWLPPTIIIAALTGLIVGGIGVRGLVRQIVTREADRPLLSLTVLLVGGVLMAFWFGWTAKGGGLFFALLLVVAMASAGAVGSLMGFLFGIPRFDYDVPAANASTSSAATVPTTTAGATRVGARYRPSSNLDDVADWLTKIIIGLGLTQLLNIGKGLRSITEWILRPLGPGLLAHQGFLSALIVSGAIGGFLFGYVWTRLHYGRLAARADRDIDRLLLDAALGIGIGKPGEPALVVDDDDSDEAARLRGRIQEAADPNKGKFGGVSQANGRVLIARIDPRPETPGIYLLTLTVKASTLSNPLQGFVTFHLHPTFRQRIVTRPVDRGEATLVVLTYGAFTVGAVADEGRTRLELDLAQHPEATEEFRSR